MALFCAHAFAQTTDVSVQKFADELGAGTFSYRIEVANSGPSPAADVTMTDVLPPEVVFLNLAAPPGWNCTTPPPNSTGTINCTIPSLPSSEADELRIDVSPVSGTPQGTLVTNTAAVTTSTAETTTANNSATRITAVGVYADTTVTLGDAPDPARASHTVTYVINGLNVGPDAAPNPILTIDPFTGATFESISPPAGWTCVPPATPDGVITCTGAVLPLGYTQFLLTITTPPTPGGSTGVAASITSSAIEVMPNNQSDSETTSLLPGPILIGGKGISSGGQFAGGNVHYFITLQNVGSATQSDSVGDELVDVLPDSLTLISASATSGLVAADVAGNRVTWNGEIFAGASAVIQITAFVKPSAAGSPVANTAEVQYDSNGDLINDTAISTNTVTFTPAAIPPTIPTASEFGLFILVAGLALVAAVKLR